MIMPEFNRLKIGSTHYVTVKMIDHKSDNFQPQILVGIDIVLLEI